MASTIVTKNSSTASAVPLTGDLTQGELAVNVTDKKLYTKDSGGTVVKLVGGLGNQEANAVAITGGSVNGTTIGATTASTGAFTTLSASGTTTLSGGTANGVAYLNGSKVVTTGSALTFDGTNLGVGTASPNQLLDVRGANGVGMRFLETTTGNTNRIQLGTGSGYGYIDATAGAGSTALAFQVASSEQMRLTSTGLGIGTSSPQAPLDVYSAGNTILRISGSSGGGGDVSQIDFFRIGSNVTSSLKAIRDGGNTSGALAFYTASAGTNAEKMRLDASGNLGLGVTPSAWSSDTVALQVGGSTFSAFAASARFLGLANARWDGTNFRYLGGGSAQQYRMSAGTGTHEWYVAPSGTAGNAITFTQAMTLDASGNLLVGTTTVIRAGKISVSFADASSRGIVTKTDVTTTSAALLFTNPNGDVGNITTSGSATAYNTSSDYRLKHDVAPMTGALAKVAALKPVTYKWNADNSDGEGFIAHELAEVVPQCVTGEKDAVDEEGNPKYQGIDTSFLVATLTAAIQEQQALIQQLTERITALEGK